MGVRRNFSRGGDLDILLIIFTLLTMQCKCKFTKRFALSMLRLHSQKSRFLGIVMLLSFMLFT